MKFSSKTEYGVRVMVDLASHFGKGPLSLTEIARDEDLPLPYLEHIVSPLRKAGLVVSHHGVHGGYELTHAPGEITMRAVLHALEGPLAPMVCATEGERDEFCAREDFCGTKTLWMRIRESIATALDSMTLADLAPQNGIAVRAREFRSLVQLPQVQAECADQEVVRATAQITSPQNKAKSTNRTRSAHATSERA